MPLCISADRCGCFFPELVYSFLPEEPGFLALILLDYFSGDVLFSKFTFSCRIRLVIDDLSLYNIFGVSWFWSVAFSLGLAPANSLPPFSGLSRPEDLSFEKRSWKSSSRI